jgi:hypothetical protein
LLRSRLSLQKFFQERTPNMKVQWITVLSIAGMISLSAAVFGAEVQWKTPANDAAVAPSVMHIPAVIPSDDILEPLAILQVQQVAQAPIPLPRMAPALSTPVNGDAPAPPMVRGAIVPCNDLIRLRSIKEISHDIRPKQADILPEECAISSEPFYGRSFGETCFMWKASALSTKAAYFEDVQLERHGHTKVCPELQPIVSGAKFFLTVPFLPYKMGVTPPEECVYTLGHQRPGSYTPYMREPLPISARGALFQAGAVLGGAFAIP